ncbi:short-chain dehydrogenase/reductase-like protein [Annulohypoxylon nitens]|nr:short-chain dehydrogenase/reductase-like protein [Annulohypoxylon nitens]
MNRSFVRSLWTQLAPLPPPTADFTGKTVIITGGNRSLGFEAALHFVRLNAHKVILGCRNVGLGLESKVRIEETTNRTGVVEVWEIDLGIFSSVRSFCRRATTLTRLDIVIANAALKSSKYACFEGYERQVTVNIISTWLMSLMLLPFMKQTKDRFYQSSKDYPHLTIVSSNAHFYAPFESRKQDLILESLKGEPNMTFRYHDTKLISLLFSRAIADRMRSPGKELSVVLNMVDPGYCQSDLLRERPYPFPMNSILGVLYYVLARSAEMGSRTYIAAAKSGLESHGLYLEDCVPSTPSVFVTSSEGQKAQQRVFDELTSILETIEPGIMKGI